MRGVPEGLPVWVVSISSVSNNPQYGGKASGGYTEGPGFFFLSNRLVLAWRSAQEAIDAGCH
jgi:hypothetical protein